MSRAMCGSSMEDKAVKTSKRDSSQQGQSLLIIAAGMVALIGLVAVVLDAGNDYVQHRQLQNSTDAAAQAGALQIGTVGNTNGEVSDAVNKYAQSNGTDPTKITAYYVVRDGQGNNLVAQSGSVDTFGRNNPIPANLTVNGVSYPVVGIQVTGNR